MSNISKGLTKFTLVDSPEKMRPQGTTYGIIIPQVRRETAQKKEPISKPENKTKNSEQALNHQLVRLGLLPKALKRESTS